MKLSNETLNILKNFGNISEGIHFKKGNILRTMSSQKNILAEATIEENIPETFGVYDLNNFLSVVSLHKDNPTFEFDSNHVMIVSNNGRSKIHYRFCDPSMVVSAPEKTLEMPNPEINFELTSEDFNWILRAAAVLGSPQICIESDGDTVYIKAVNLQNDSSHTDALELRSGSGSVYNMVFKTESLTKLLPGNYDVSITTKGISLFNNKNIKLRYYVTTELGSTYSAS
jgi:hypothetical protein